MCGFDSRCPLFHLKQSFIFYMGALTSKPFSFSARSWEIQDKLAYDFTDTFFSPLKINLRGSSIIRVLPELTNFSLSEWISDRTRFSYDLLGSSNFDSYRSRRFKLFSVPLLHFFSKRFSFLESFYFDYTSAVQNQFLFNFSGFSKFSFQSAQMNFDFRPSYYFDFNSISTFSFKDYFFLGVNIRYQLPVFAIGFRKVSYNLNSNFFNFGFFSNNLFNEFNFGSSLKNFFTIIRGKSKISRLYFSNSTFAIANPQIFSFIRFSKPQACSFFDFPKKLSSSEVFSVSSFKSSSFSPYVPHFYFSNQVFPYRSSLEFFESSLFPETRNYGFYFFKKNFSNYFINFCPLFNFTSSIFLYSNFYTHYSYSSHSEISINLLLALKRQINFRNNFNYYTL